MTFDEIKLLRLHRQHLLSAVQPKTVVADLCGLQAQFLGHALQSLSIRSKEVNTKGMIKSWTLRGTLHIFAEADLALFLHEGRRHFLRPVDTMDTDNFISGGRKAYFAELIMDAISGGTDDRESLKLLCQDHGMTDREEESLFDPWGGMIRALCESGRICHKVQEKKAYRICPAFEPMDRETAQTELARRYFTNYGPATVKDAAYFFGTTQKEVKSWLQKLPVTATGIGKDVFYQIGSGSAVGEIPECLFLAGFDPLLLGYEKSESLFLSQQHLRQIFTLSGIVRPAILTEGNITGWWNYKHRKLTVNDFGGCSQSAIEETAHAVFPDLDQIIVK